eukprot:TRINITY_DN2497_c0_g1_i10.p1 TRINITY_DN2497_c0_g1~~TRINITY_DN2497_c0_g1_i10.p1  ORF type:complete len:472 (+),score=97.84 TRINITY_DN2497_c0_g1_i10:24-1418(+)
MIRRPPRSTLDRSSAASDVYKRQVHGCGIMPASKAVSEKVNAIVRMLRETGKREKRKVAAHDARQVIFAEVIRLNKQQVVAFTVSLFVFVAGYYRLDKSFARCRCRAVLRSSIRKMLNKLNKLFNVGHKQIASLINFEYYKVFEKSIGKVLNIQTLDFEATVKNLPKLIKASHDIYLSLDKHQIPLDNFTKMPFYLVNLTPDRRSSHVIICFSGYMSERDKMEREWRHVAERERESCVFAVVWRSHYLEKLLKSSSREVGKLLLMVALKMCTAPILIALAGLGITKEVIDTYIKAEKQAKLVGYAIANIIAKSELFRYQCVSLVGFSLGTKAVLSCLKELKQIGAHEPTLIDNVVLMGGAAILKKRKLEKWRRIFDCVSGRIINVYATNDWALKALGVIKRSFLNGNYPLGTKELVFDKLATSDNVVSKCIKRIHNYNVTEFVPGHLSYRKNLGYILELINFER